MKAMVLAAGFGTRLGELTANRPKCLVEAGGRTILELVIDRLKHAGVTEIVINLHYLGEQIKAYVESKARFGLRVHFSEERKILGTGGGLKQAAHFFRDEPCFLVHNSDVYSDLDLNEVIAAHRKQEPVATLAVMSRPTERALLFDQSSVLVGYQGSKQGDYKTVRECAAPLALGFSGIQVCSPRIFNFMQHEQGDFSTIRAYMNAAASGEAVLAYRMEQAYWIDMGTPERLAELRARLGQG